MQQQQQLRTAAAAQNPQHMHANMFLKADVNHNAVTFDLSAAQIYQIMYPFLTKPQQYSWEWVQLDRPVDGTLLVIKRPGELPFPSDGYGWMDADSVSHIKYQVQNYNLVIEMRARKLGFAPGDNYVSMTRRVYRLVMNNSDVYLMQYLRYKGPAVPVVNRAKSTARAVPTSQLNSYGDELDISTPKQISLDRYKRNHEFITEIFAPYGSGIVHLPLAVDADLTPNLDALKEAVEKAELELESLQKKYANDVSAVTGEAIEEWKRYNEIEGCKTLEELDAIAI
ncbi:hypothetical protein BJ742DRAFT_802478 [Cladochytrium replicatum]|nr:hypothetical protein BJ742DRAFT_802478 [Cladochytrium replicatum]